MAKTVKVAETSGLAPGTSKVVQADGHSIGLFNVEGTFTRDNTCTHRAACGSGHACHPGHALALYRLLRSPSISTVPKICVSWPKLWTARKWWLRG